MLATLGLIVATAKTPQLEPTLATAIVQQEVKHKDFDTDIIAPLRQAQAVQAEKDAQAAAEAAREAEEQAQAAAQAQVIAESVFQGSPGFSYSGGNCVDLAKENGKNQPGNPISWLPSTNTPFIGAAVLFYFNHVAIVTGIYPNGDIEVGQFNCPGCSTRFSPSEVRGYF